MKSGKKKRIRECVFLSLLCAGSLFGIYLVSIGPVMVTAIRLENSGSKVVTEPLAKARKFYQPWWCVYSKCPGVVRGFLDGYVELWFRSE